MTCVWNSRLILFLSLCCLYFFRACFDELQMRNVLIWQVLDYTCDGVYILDIAVRLHTGTLISFHHETDKKLLNMKYYDTDLFFVPDGILIQVSKNPRSGTLYLHLLCTSRFLGSRLDDQRCAPSERNLHSNVTVSV